MFELDHILWAAADLETAERSFEKATGVKPALGGAHPGFGTRNSLASLSRGVYFEIISLDPAQGKRGDRAVEISALPLPQLLTFAMRGTALDEFRKAAAKLDLEPSEPIAMTRTRNDGVVLSWRCVYLGNREFHNVVPFVIDWEQSEHPSNTTPTGCSIKEFCALHPDPDRLKRIYDSLAIAVPVRRAPVPGLYGVLSTPKGDVVFT